MQVGGALTVGNALWITRGAARVANTGGRIFCRFRPRIVSRTIGNERVIGTTRGSFKTRGITGDNEVLDLGIRGSTGNKTDARRLSTIRKRSPA